MSTKRTSTVNSNTKQNQTKNAAPGIQVTTHTTFNVKKLEVQELDRTTERAGPQYISFCRYNQGNLIYQNVFPPVRRYILNLVNMQRLMSNVQL